MSKDINVGPANLNFQFRIIREPSNSVNPYFRKVFLLALSSLLLIVGIRLKGTAVSCASYRPIAGVAWRWDWPLAQFGCVF